MGEEKIERRNFRGCPVCGYHLLARENDDIICLSNSCNWRVKAKRENDKNVNSISTLKSEWA